MVNYDLFIQRAHIPLLFKDASLDKLPDYPYREEILKYAEDMPAHVCNGKGLLLWGHYSSGKTYTSIALLKRGVENQLHGLFVMANELSKMVVDQRRFDQKYTWEERMLSVPLLVVDEVVPKRKRQYVDEFLEFLVRKRRYEQKATILTTNKSPDEIASISGGLAAILTEACTAIEVAGYDFRKDIPFEKPTSIWDD